MWSSLGMPKHDAQKWQFHCGMQTPPNTRFLVLSESKPERHFDRFSHFCKPHDCDQQTHRPHYICSNRLYLMVCDAASWYEQVVKNTTTRADQPGRRSPAEMLRSVNNNSKNNSSEVTTCSRWQLQYAAHMTTATYQILRVNLFIGLETIKTNTCVRNWRPVTISTAEQHE